MRHARARMRPCAAWLLLCGATLSACTSARPPGSQPSAVPVRPQAPALQPRIVQQDFGRDAVFTTCLPPDCPVRTTKVLATELPADAAGPLDALAASLDEHETLLLPARPALSPVPAGPSAAPRIGDPDPGAGSLLPRHARRHRRGPAPQPARRDPRRAPGGRS